jgi:hypothetical protein
LIVYQRSSNYNCCKLYKVLMVLDWVSNQGRIQSRRQPALGHPLDSSKNKSRMVKNNFFIRIFYLFEPGTPYQFFLAPPLYQMIMKLNEIWITINLILFQVVSGRVGSSSVGSSSVRSFRVPGHIKSGRVGYPII